mgnify:CR=1 FL=1
MATVSNALASSSNSAEQGVILYTLKIDDDDDLPQVNFTNGSGTADSESSVAENGSSITINFELSRATERTVTIPFTFADYGGLTKGAQGAAATGDYPVDWFYSNSKNASGGSAVWTTGASFDAGGSVTITGDGSTNASGTKATFDLNIESDDIDEWDEDIVINLGSPSNGIKGGTQQHTVTITDVSTAPSIAFTNFSVDDGIAETTQANNDFNLKNCLLYTSPSPRDS